MAIAVGNHPVTAEQLGCQLAAVVQGDGVGEGKAVLFRLRLFREKARGDADVDLLGGFGHGQGSAE